MDRSASLAQYTLGIDIGGSHITAGLVNLAQKSIVKDSLIRKKVDRHAPAKEILDLWAGTINEINCRYPNAFNTIGFAMPGPFDYENGICLIKGFDKYESLYGMSIRNELSAQTGIAAENILFRNDADAFLEGEMFGGAGQGYKIAIGLTLGTGLGSCLFTHGKITNAGLNVLPFKNGIAEDYLSTRWFRKRYHEHTGKEINGVRILADTYKDDEKARLVFDEFSVNFAAVLWHCMSTFEAEVIVIGGNISNAFPLFIEKVQQQLPAGRKVPVIVKASLGEHAALIGAARNYENKITSAAI
jgi:glucokinase